MWGHIIRCRFTHGRHLRSGLLGSGDWSVTFFITPLALGANSVKYVWMEERWSSLLSRLIFVWQQLITSLQTHYVLNKALLSILEQSLRWLSRAEAQLWDMYPKPTDVLWIDFMTGWIWTLESISNMSTPETNLQHFDQKHLHSWWMAPLSRPVHNYDQFNVSCSHFRKRIDES